MHEVQYFSEGNFEELVLKLSGALGVFIKAFPILEPHYQILKKNKTLANRDIVLLMLQYARDKQVLISGFLNTLYFKDKLVVYLYLMSYDTIALVPI